MVPGTVHKFPGICLIAEENLGKPQLGDSLMMAVRPVISSNGVHYFQMRLVGPHNTSGREMEGEHLKQHKAYCRCSVTSSVVQREFWLTRLL